MERFWPGALTIIFKASPDVSHLLTAGTGKIGIRLSSHPVATALAKKLGHPITATSANLSGKHECTSADEVIQGIGDQIDAVIDGGQTPGGSGSTIIDVTTDPPAILREGVIPKYKLTDSAFVLALRRNARNFSYLCHEPVQKTSRDRAIETNDEMDRK